MSASILVADIGGTNARFARFGPGGLVDAEQWSTLEVPTLGEAVARYLDLHPGVVDASCAAVAGPVLGPDARLTNTPWTGSVHDLPGRACLVNDLEAAAAAIPVLGPEDVVQIRAGELVPRAPRAVLGLGTGLGEALAVGGLVLPGEGGHKVFGPADAEQRAFAVWLADSLGRPASWEDILGGDGLGRCLSFVRGDSSSPAGDQLARLARAATSAPGTADGRSAMGLYTRCCAVEARNMGLQVLARGGVWLVGGMPARIPDAIWRESFETHFVLPGAMVDQAAMLCVSRVLHPAVNLLGAGVLAMSGGRTG